MRSAHLLAWILASLLLPSCGDDSGDTWAPAEPSDAATDAPGQGGSAGVGNGGSAGVGNGGSAGVGNGGSAGADAGVSDATSDNPATPDANPTDQSLPAKTFDVVVVGAGSGGVAAAIQAARLGAKVALVEETDWVGGQMTTAGVSTMDGGFGPPTDTGLYDEFRKRVVQYYADPVRFPPSGKSVGTCYWSNSTTCFEPFVGQQILREMLQSTSVALTLRRTVTAVHRSGNRVTGVVLDDGQQLDAHVVVDATERGDLLPLAGAAYRIGRTTGGTSDPEACIQSLTHLAIIKRYPNGLPAGFSIASPPPGYAQVKPLFASIVASSGSQGFPINYPVNWNFHSAYRGLPDSSNPSNYTASQSSLITKTGVNWANDYPGYKMVSNVAQWVDTLKISYLEDAVTRHAVDCQAKLTTLSFVYYLQHELGHADWSVANDEGYDTPHNLQSPDCANIPPELETLEHHLALYPYVRESRRIVALHTLTAKEIKRTNGAPTSTNFDSSIAVGTYPTDLHNCDASSQLESSLGETAADASGSGPFQVPMESLIPASLDGLLAAEKNIGVSRLANGAIRLQPITMSTGQAVGVLAALAAQSDQQPRNVPVLDVQRELLAAKSALSRFTYDDVPLSSGSWIHVQLLSTYGNMIGTSTTHFGLADDMNRAQAATLLARVLKLNTSSPPATPTFGDVPKTHWAYPYVEAMAKAGITSGCQASPPLFCPDNPVTRAQLVTLAVRGLKLDPSTAPSTPYYTDVPASHSLFAFVQLAKQQGLLSSCGASTFCPDVAAKRSAGAEVGYVMMLK